MKTANDWAREYVQATIEGGKMTGVNITSFFERAMAEARAEALEEAARALDDWREKRRFIAMPGEDATVGNAAARIRALKQPLQPKPAPERRA